MRLLLSLPGRCAIQFERQCHVLQRGERGHQVVLLEHQADRASPQARAIFGRRRRDVNPGHKHPPACGCIKSSRKVEERGLARSAGTHDRDELAVLDPKAHLIEGVHLALAFVMNTRDLLELQQRGHRLPLRSFSDNHAAISFAAAAVFLLSRITVAST